MKNEDLKEGLRLFFSGLQIAGFFWILLFFGGLVKFAIRHQPIPWGRAALILAGGIGMYLLGRKGARKHKCASGKQMQNEDTKESLRFFFYALQVVGALLVTVFFRGFVKFAIYQQPIPWIRDVLMLVGGIGIYLLGRKGVKKYQKI